MKRNDREQTGTTLPEDMRNATQEKNKKQPAEPPKKAAGRSASGRGIISEDTFDLVGGLAE